MSSCIHSHHRHPPFVARVEEANAISAHQQLKQMLQAHRNAGNTVEETRVGLLQRFKIYDAAGWMATLWLSDRTPAKDDCAPPAMTAQPT